MGKIDLTINKTGLQHNIEKAKENNVIRPSLRKFRKSSRLSAFGTSTR